MDLEVKEMLWNVVLVTMGEFGASVFGEVEQRSLAV